MTRNRTARWSLLVLSLGFGTVDAAAAEKGFQPEVRVGSPTRLDWRFVLAALDPAAALPAVYDARAQRYQLFVPREYDTRKAWPLVVFISPGDEPLGWPCWQQTCEQGGALFCAAYGAGNNCPLAQRVRIVLDMFDDVRRRCRVDPDQTYVVGFAGGGRLACAVGFALPEYIGGVVAISGAGALNDLPYLRQRVRDRLSVALATGAGDLSRKESEDYFQPLLADLGIRSRVWVAAAAGPALPSADTLAEIHAWLAEDLARRRDSVTAYPGLAATADEVPTVLQQATRQMDTAVAELGNPERTWRAVALLEGVEARWPQTAAAEKARRLLQEVRKDPTKARLLDEQRRAEQRSFLIARARALERFGHPREALGVLLSLIAQHPGTPEGTQAATTAKRLTVLLGTVSRGPFLGLELAGDSATVARVTRGGPAERAGVRPGDVLRTLGAAEIGSLWGLRAVLQVHRAGERLTLEVRRDGKLLALKVELGSRPPGND